jgi:hypothetical protein
MFSHRRLGRKAIRFGSAISLSLSLSLSLSFSFSFVLDVDYRMYINLIMHQQLCAVESSRDIASAGTRTIKAEYHCSKS